MKEIINLPLISQDLREDEVCIRAIKTFEFLNNVIDDIFDRIESRVKENMTKMEKINKRLEAASSKIESLKGSRKAIRMYSQAKYPIPNTPIFSETFKNFSVNEIDFSYNLQSSSDPNRYKEYSEKLQFFHIKRNRQKISEKPNLVFQTNSINSLITFVNNENIVLNDLSSKTRAKEKTSTTAQDINDTADFNRFSSFMKTKRNDYFHYSPNRNQAPEIELPLDLPELPGIADDISFSLTDKEIIDSSLTKMNIVNELPNVAELMEADSSKKLTQTLSSNQDEGDSKVLSTKSEISNVPAVPANIPPPPPPPIPQNFIPAAPPIPKDITNIKNKTQAVAPQEVSESGDARSSLMQAIRNAGGKVKLKAVPARDEDVTNAKKNVQKLPAMDLMSDLHAKLALRRRGIAGTKETKKEKSSILAKVSSLIPAPTERSESDNDSESNDGSDWD
ncbi:CLUMA_CG017970, isoform A [Clunio marinus]|uniref:CLUMA_CG017970, isoform A n=1 Tax=Clunio marinus TaxID=568069 RepID=A0A1J1J022_9DIPT|nr:CLUMA_CG017970, isoform A [Clunio marinus]